MLKRRARLFWFLNSFVCGVLLLVGLAVLVEQVFRASQGVTDFCQDYVAAFRLVHGEPPYLPLRLWAGPIACSLPGAYDAHPPASVLLFVPFGLLPQIPATVLWGFCLLAAYLASGALLLQALGWLSLRGLALFVIASLYWQPLIGAEGAQNLWQLLILLLVASWRLEHSGRYRWAGGLLGLAGLLKIWPAALLLGAMVRGRWRLALAGWLALILGMLLAWLFLGPDAYATYLGPVRAGENESIAVVGNISLVGAVARLFIGDPPFLPPGVRGLTLNQAVLVGEGVAGLLLVGALAFIWWCHRRRPCQAADDLQQGLLVTVLLLAFPLTWHFGLILLLLPGALMVLALRQVPLPPRWWFILLVVSLLPLLAPYSLFTFAQGLLEQQGAGVAWLALLICTLPTAGLALFAGAQGYLLWRATDQPVSERHALCKIPAC